MEFYLQTLNFEGRNDAKSVQKFSVEKVYGDFKRLHSYIIETFQNELKEYERVESIMQSGEHGQGESYFISMNPSNDNSTSIGNLNKTESNNEPE